MNPFDTCPNCDSPNIRKGKVPLYVGGYYVGQFDGYWCPVCREQFLDPAVIDEAQTAVMQRGLFGISSRQVNLPRPLPAFHSFHITATNIQPKMTEFSISTPEEVLSIVTEIEPDGASSRTYSVSHAWTR